MGVGSGLYMYDVVVRRWRSLSHLLMSSCLTKQVIWRTTLQNRYAKLVHIMHIMTQLSWDKICHRAHV